MTTAEQDVGTLWAAFKIDGDARAREQLIVHYAPLVKYVSGRVAIGLPPTIDLDDLQSYGIFGLVDAVEKFEPERGVKFETYAIARIRGAMFDGLREQDWVPRTVRQKARHLERTVAELEARLGRSATDAEVCVALGLTSDEYFSLLTEIRGTSIVSLDEWWAGEGDEDKGLSLGELIEDPEAAHVGAAIEAEQVEQMLGDVIDALPEREKLIITLYYYEGMTLKEIGHVLGVTESRVSQLHTRAIVRLRARLRRFRDALVS